MEVKDIPISKIIISDLNVRKNLDAGHEDSTLDDLAKSIHARARQAEQIESTQLWTGK